MQSIPARSKSLFSRNLPDISLLLNEGEVALNAGNFDLAAEHARSVIESRKARKNSVLSARLLQIRSRSRQGLFTGVMNDLDLLFRRIPKANLELQSRVGNEILWVCFRSGNLGIGAQKGEEMVRNFSSKWPRAQVVEMLCQLSSCHFHRGDTARAEEVVTQALEIAEKSSSAKARTQTLWQSSALTMNRGNLVLALQLVSDAKHWAQIAGLQNVLPILNYNASIIMLDLPHSDLSRVHRLAESAYLDMSSQNNAGGAAYACTVLSEVALRQENYTTALKYATQGLNELPVEIPGPKTALLVQTAKVLARKGQLDDAKFALFDAVEHMEQLEPSNELAKQWGDLARVFVEVGLADRGVYAYEKAIQMSGLLREEQEAPVN